MNKIEIQKALSENATGIDKAETEVYSVKGVSEKCENITLKVEPHNNKLIISYDKVYLNSDNEEIGRKSINNLNILDIPERGEVEIDENYQEVAGTYTKISDEVLTVTNWNSQLGSVIINALIDFVKSKEGYN